MSIIIDVLSESHVQIEVKLNANVTKKQKWVGKLSCTALGATDSLINTSMMEIVRNKITLKM